MDKTDARLIQAVILLNRQYGLIERLIETQNYTLTKFEEAISKKEQAIIRILDVYNYVFALIDNIERYRKTAFSIPKLNHKSSEYRALVKALGNVEDARHQLQHLNNKIENDYTGPLLGSIFWVAGSKQYIAAFHDIGRERSAPGAIFDNRIGKYIHEFCYVYNDKYYDLQKAVEGIKTFNDYINSSFKIQIDGKDFNIESHAAAICVEFNPIHKRWQTNTPPA